MFRYYPDQEVVFWTTGDQQEEKLCSIEVILICIFYPTKTVFSVCLLINMGI